MKRATALPQREIKRPPETKYCSARKPASEARVGSPAERRGRPMTESVEPRHEKGARGAFLLSKDMEGRLWVRHVGASSDLDPLITLLDDDPPPLAVDRDALP